MSYTHIFWDFNGTIIDDVGNALACVNDLLTRKGRSHITLEDYYTYVETPIIGFYYHILPPDEVDFDEISRAYHSDYARHLDETQLAEGAYDLLHSLCDKGIHQYIITANNIDEVHELLDKYRISDCFEAVLGADNNLAESKTQRALKLFEELKPDPRQVLFVGDTLHDLETANALGVDCVLVEYGHQGRRLLREKGAYTVPSLKEVEKIILDNRTIDLHTHSTCSDGTLTPRELVLHAKASGLSAIALTDHDTVDGIAQARECAEKIGLELIPGIEFSASDETETHIIGLFIDPESPELLALTRQLREHRKNRVSLICQKLQAMDMDITAEECQRLSGNEFVGRSHIAAILTEKGYCQSIPEAFDKYIGFGKPAYVRKNELTAAQAVKAIKDAGGLAFLAHLHQTKYSVPQLKNLLISLKEAGLDGIEGYYTEYTSQHIEDYRNLAIELSLRLSGGSDFHADMKPHIKIGTGTENLRIPYFILDSIKDLKK